MRWRPYTAPSVVGDLRVLRGELDRDLYVWLPSGYDESGRSYPTLYLHDAQNLFDADLSSSGEWRVDETLTELAADGLELIAVGIPHAGVLRSHEYVGRGLDEHVHRLVHRVKPLVDGDFRTGGPTGVGGSSFGAYASLYAWAAHPRTFSRVLAMSPAFFGDRPRIFAALADADPADARIWVDVGGREHDDPRIRDEYLDGVRAMTELLRGRGFDERSLRSEVHPAAVHHESAWAERLPAAIRHLFGPSG
jgi:predicted alpha/beta superfamily hydrolase